MTSPCTALLLFKPKAALERALLANINTDTEVDRQLAGSGHSHARRRKLPRRLSLKARYSSAC